MRNRIVHWGTDKNDEKVLIAMELKPAENKVLTWVFPDRLVTDDFQNKMFREWRNDQEVDFPEGVEAVERSLTIADSLLPEDLKTDKPEVISRVQTEWHFTVLSYKLNEAYTNEINEIKEKIAKLESYEASYWDQLKGFWEKVQDQIRDKNLSFEQGTSIKQQINNLFAQLKNLKNSKEEAIKKQSTELFASFSEMLKSIEEKANGGARYNVIFEELKSLQQKFKNAKFTNEDRNQYWEQINAAFSAVKERTFGTQDGSSPTDRLGKRLAGLVASIQKMENSLKYDQEELDFQSKKIASTDGQLEAQIRQAKMVMIQERIRSKETKLKEMNDLKVDLEKQAEVLKQKEEKRAEKEKVMETRKQIQDKIASEIQQKAGQVPTDLAAKIESAAAEIAARKSDKTEKKEKVEETEEASTTFEEMSLTEKAEQTLEDVVDTAKAVVSVVGDKIVDAVSDFLHPKEEGVAEVEEETSQEEETKEEEKEKEA